MLLLRSVADTRRTAASPRWALPEGTQRYMKCFDPKVIGGLALTALAVLLVAPSAFSAVLPLLAVAACPLGMLFMMKGMSGGKCGPAGSGTGTDRQGETDAASAPQGATEDEVIRLRAEVDQLRAADRDARERGGPGR